jgi:hypothetical protein
MDMPSAGVEAHLGYCPYLRAIGHKAPHERYVQWAVAHPTTGSLVKAAPFQGVIVGRLPSREITSKN